jgi:hypothetical protein
MRRFIEFNIHVGNPKPHGEEMRVNRVKEILEKHGDKKLPMGSGQDSMK